MRVFLLGLDGATFDLILPWVKEEKLPNLSRLLKHSYYGKLESLPPITPAGWTSIITGVNCGKHGLADFLKMDHRDYQLTPTSRLDRKVDTIYNILGKIGKKVILLNYPLTYPAEKVNGHLVTGLQTPKKDERCTYPFGKIDDLEKELGEIRFMVNYQEGQSREEFLAEIRKLTQCRERMVLHYLNNHTFDLFAAVFMGPDIVSHSFWKYMDKGHPEHEGIDPEELGLYEHAILNVYEQIDGSVGKIIEALEGTDTAIILVSDHGSGPLHKYVNLNKFLLEKGHLSICPEKRKGERGKVRRAITRFLSGFGKRSGESDSASGPVKDDDRYFSEVDWAKTRAYSWGNLCSININMKGREGLGIVDAVDSAELKKNIVQDLMALVDDNGKRLVDDVGFSDNVFRGPYVGEMPDLYMVMQDITIVGRGLNPIYRDITGRPMIETADLSGTHRIHGIYAISDLCTDKRIVRRQEEFLIKGKDYKVYDIAPTILRLFDMDSPDHFDGIVMKDAFC